MIQTATAICGVFCTTCVVTFIVVFCSFISYFVSDIEQHLKELNQMLNAIENRTMTARKRIDLYNKLIGIIRFHSEARELSIEFHSVWKCHLIQFNIHLDLPRRSLGRAVRLFFLILLMQSFPFVVLSFWQIR